MKNIQVLMEPITRSMTSSLQLMRNIPSVFPAGTDAAFIDEVYQNQPSQTLDAAFTAIRKRRVPKREAMGIYGILFYECDHKKIYYPTRRDEEAVNPNSSRLR